MSIALHILTPEGTVARADVSLVTLPGELSPFTVLPGHAAIVTSLSGGDVRYIEDGREKRVGISGGFARVENDTVTVCAEL